MRIVLTPLLLALVAPAAAPAQPAGLEPPRLVEAIDADYPPAAKADGREGEVLLRLTVDTAGQVASAEVVQSPGSDLAEAAKAAALRLRFEPAKRDGVAITARIPYTFTFRVPPTAPVVEAPEEAPAPVGEAPPAAEETLEVTVQGETPAQALARSAEAVDVIETEEAGRQAADLGEVLARTEGIDVRRGGGLGSDSRISLNGLGGERIRFFLDGVPLELAGFPFGLTNVPVNLIEQVEVYRGVLPIRFGADALGGAIHLVSRPVREGTGVAASLQGGSFGTYRSTVGAHHLDEASGWYARVHAFGDRSDNDYPVYVEEARVAESGRTSPGTVDRFHDGYLAYGGGLEAGMLDGDDRVRLRLFASDYEKELQNSPTMSVVYGEAAYGGTSTGGSASWEKRLGAGVTLEAIAAYAYQTTDFVDDSGWVYDWFGNRVNERDSNRGEISGMPTDRTLWQHGLYGRLGLEWKLRPNQTLRLAVSPAATIRSGEEHLDIAGNTRDKLAARRDLARVVSGLEYQLDLFDERLQGIGFVKDYLYAVRAEDPIDGADWIRADQDVHRFGGGVALRWKLERDLYARTSWELATRLPSPDEVFGDSRLILANLELLPEQSHNFNLGFTAERMRTVVGAFRADVNGFARLTDQMIVLLGIEPATYRNVNGARSLGVEAATGWRSPGDLLSIDLNSTWQDVRNTSNEGTFGDKEGDRIPAQPWFFANGSVQLDFRGTLRDDDRLSPFWISRFVHEFFRSWEGDGRESSKDLIPAQLSHTAGLLYVVGARPAWSWSLEVQNLTDEKVYDFFGVQRPGRAIYAKGTIEY